MSMSALVPPFRAPMRRHPGSFRTRMRFPEPYRAEVLGGATDVSFVSVQMYVTTSATLQKRTSAMKTLLARPFRIARLYLNISTEKHSRDEVSWPDFLMVLTTKAKTISSNEGLRNMSRFSSESGTFPSCETF